MAHQAIYRKWRPMTFDDVVGQTHITKTLKNQILQDNIAHAYLFCGTRGTGKTTCAKIFSRAVNCLNSKDGNPCNECDVCKGIIDGSIMDVTEMDAASNNGVDDIRNIKDDINYIASNTKYTVYIIDEVHMLSPSAFNALLKTLEEPPENVIFILATTEAHKVPQTILSRCQRFDFKRIKNDDIIVRMKEIAYADGYKITDSAFRMLATLADGSMRDGLSIMERVISAAGREVDESDITEALGISTLDTVFELTDSIINGDSAGVIAAIDKTMSDGKDLSQLASSVLAHFRSLMVCKLSKNADELLDYDKTTIVKIKSQSEKISFDTINHASTLISKAISDARLAKSARIIYELAFIKLTRPEVDQTPEGVMARLAAVEQKVDSGGGVQRNVIQSNSANLSESTDIMRRLSAVEDAIKNGSVSIKEEAPKPEPEKKKHSHRLYAPIAADDLHYDYPTARLARNWNNTVEIMIQNEPAIAMPLRSCMATFDSDGIVVLVPEEKRGFTEKVTKNNIEKLRNLFQSITQTQYTIKIAFREDIEDRFIINPFELPKKEGAQTEEPHLTHKVENTKSSDKFNEFFNTFANIIVDADKSFDNFDAEKEAGVQSSFNDVEIDDEDENDEKEEFLTDGELPSDEDDS